MTTKKIVSHSHSTSSSVEATAPASTEPAAANPPAAASHSLPAYLTPPPAAAAIPQVPQAYVPESGTTYRAVIPKKAELVALPLAVGDLRRFTNYALIVGGTAPPYEEILHTFDVTNQWSSMRTASSAWDVFSRDQEGICWTVMRPGMEALKSAFDLAAKRDPSIIAMFPGLATLLGVKKAIANKGVSTKRANKKAVAEGKPPTHGQVGKKRKKAANAAIIAAANALVAAQGPAGGTATVPVVAPVVSAAPVAVSAPEAATNGAVVAPALPVGTNGIAQGLNGAGH